VIFEVRRNIIMKFFIPLAEDDAQAERVITATSEFTKFAIPSPRIYSIDYEHNSKRMRATVGEDPDGYYREVGPVICILANDNLLAVCTRDRGVLKGEPILVGRQSVSFINYFDEA
jgi:hypothetical protein